MPLPFSFSTQRHSFDSETAVGTGGPAVLEVVMQQPPGLISTEPLLGTPGNTFTPPPVIDLAASAERAAAIAALLPPAPSPNQRPALAAEPSRPPVILLADTLNLPPPVPVAQAPSTPLLQPQPEWAAQMEQLRNDIFGIAMSVSALNDRIDRLDQRAPQAAGAGLATLRSEIEAWLENHLNAAVEHCMHRIANRAPTVPAVPPPSN
ncbi:MAG: hypothetical protein ACO1TE_10985 [Prosthecobacter sp.]